MNNLPTPSISGQTDAASEQRWRLLFEQSPLSIQIFDPEGNTIRFNPAWSKLFGLNSDEAYAFNVLKAPELIESGAVNLIRKAFEGETVFVPPVPFPVRGHPQQIRWIGGTVFPVITPDGVLHEVVVIHHDITELKEAEETSRKLNEILEERVAVRTAELHEAQDQLKLALDKEREVNEMRSRFVSIVSHEFRTPLGVIMSAIELIRHYDDRLSPEKKAELHEDIVSSTRLMAGLMENVLVLGRVEAVKLATCTEPCDLVALVGRLVDESLSVTHQKCPVNLESKGDLTGAYADEALLRHILGNLITNAVKYSPAGSQVEFTIRREGKDAFFQIIDQGIGIPEQDRERLFEAFHRCSNVGDVPGTGLGLVIVKRCVDLFGGSLEINSVIGEGTTFTVRLPLFPEPE